METIENFKRNASSLEDHLGYWLRCVSNQVSGNFARALDAQKTSVAEWVLLSHLYNRPQATAGELAQVLTMTRGAVSKIVDKLEAKNWITCRISTEDTRVRLLSLTSRGRRTFPHLAKIAGRNDDEFFACLNSDERASLRRTLQKLVDFHQIRGVPVD